MICTCTDYSFSFQRAKPSWILEEKSVLRSSLLRSNERKLFTAEITAKTRRNQRADPDTLMKCNLTALVKEKQITYFYMG